MTRATIERRLAYYESMIGCVEEKLTPAERLAFHLWDDHRPDGLPTSKWPGFLVHGVVWPKETDAPPTQPETRRRQDGPPIPSALRWAVWERDDFTCQHCGTRQDLSVDHIIPRSRGGLTNVLNLQTLCRSCNSKKGVR